MVAAIKIPSTVWYRFVLVAYILAYKFVLRQEKNWGVFFLLI